ncbi:hypothetical protein DIZ27_37995 [Streptomyces sp. NWU339]|uniref:hypothetical protein n=1 Tax=Streptomyces sp. NWU339 TaxID=2185284 RepID=UPI000D6742DA|nr:hypothetical protein [Streptomyces sp. NWU339]PWI05638.1 hypothetical protein DIZ27_37995 [Streptomyces sp. NWU339]
MHPLGRQQPVGEPTKLRGGYKAFGLTGGVLNAAQAPAYIREYGVLDGLGEMLKDSIDPFGFHRALDPPAPQVA